MLDGERPMENTTVSNKVMIARSPPAIMVVRTSRADSINIEDTFGFEPLDDGRSTGVEGADSMLMKEAERVNVPAPD